MISCPYDPTATRTSGRPRLYTCPLCECVIVRGVPHPTCGPEVCDTPKTRAWQQAHAVALAVRTKLNSIGPNRTSIWTWSPDEHGQHRRWFARNGIELARLVLQATGDEETEA